PLVLSRPGRRARDAGPPATGGCRPRGQRLSELQRRAGVGRLPGPGRKAAGGEAVARRETMTRRLLPGERERLGAGVANLSDDDRKLVYADWLEGSGATTARASSGLSSRPRGR